MLKRVSWLICLICMIAAGLLAGLLMPSRSLGQTTFATITGAVTDSTGAVIPGAEVTATHIATNITTKTQANSDGIYTIAQLKEGEYVVRASSAGFKEFVAGKLLIEAREYRRIDIRMELGQVADKVEVTAGAALIETETSRISDTRTAQQLTTLPRESGGFSGFLTLTPGFNKQTSAQASFNGSRAGEAIYTIDGTTFSDGSSNENFNGPLSRSTEWYQELKINVANNGAEFGTVANVTIISKSGSNDLHGSAYDYYSSPFMRARDPFATERASGVSHRVGFTVGGPIYLPRIYNGRDRTFFFLTFDTARQGQLTELLNTGVPLEAWRRGDFSALGVQIRNPFTGEIYRDGRIPASQINPVAKKIQDRFYPLPNFGDTSVFAAGNFNQNIQFPFGPPLASGARLDHRFSERDSVFARYTISYLHFNSWDGGLPAFGPREQFRRIKGLTVSHTHTFNSRMVNEARFGHHFNNNPGQGPLEGQEVVGDLGLQGLAPNLPNLRGVLNVNWTGIGLRRLTQTSWRRPLALNKIHQFQDNFSYFRGRHSLKTGVDIRWIESASRTAGDGLFGNVTFANTYTRVPGVTASGHPYADFLFGVPTSASRNFPPGLGNAFRWTDDFFVQDDWKVTNRLTLNLGLRYDYHTPWKGTDGQIALFDVEGGRILVADEGFSKVSPLVPTGYVQIVKASEAGLPAETLLFTDKNNFAPRLGIAWKPFQNNHTVIRGGYGLYYFAGPISTTQGANPPFSIVEPTFTNTTPAPTIVLPQVFPGAGGGGPSTINLPTAINPRLKTQYSQQWNLTIEHERWQTGFRVSYIGTAGRQLLYSRNINSPVPDDRLFVDKPRRFPRYPAISFIDNGTNHNYHALNLEAEHKFRKGLFFQTTYTWARDVGDAAEGGTTGLENPFDRRRERAVNVSVPTHRASLASIWELPVGRQRRWFSNAPRPVDLVIGGWQMSLIATFQTGQFLTPVVSIPDPTGTAFTTGRNRPTVTIRADQLRDGRLPDATINRWFDPAAFAAPPIGRYGTSANGVLVGPGINVWHIGFQKYFVFSDNPRVPKLRFDVRAQNAFNHPNWGLPDTNLTNTGSVATIRSVGFAAVGFDGVGARDINLALRLEW